MEIDVDAIVCAIPDAAAASWFVDVSAVAADATMSAGRIPAATTMSAEPIRIPAVTMFVGRIPILAAIQDAVAVMTTIISAVRHTGMVSVMVILKDIMTDIGMAAMPAIQSVFQEPVFLLRFRRQLKLIGVTAFSDQLAAKIAE